MANATLKTLSAKRVLVSSITLVLCCCALLAAAQGAGPEFDAWVQQQRGVALAKTLANISPAGTARGCVVAATSKDTSKDAPNYWYHWVRDSGLVMDALLGEYETTANATLAAALERTFLEYATFTLKNQNTRSRSASPTDPMGLGEPKYEVDGTPFLGDWGRPQLDGPALRASALMRFAQEYLRRGGSLATVRDLLYAPALPAKTAVKADLEVVSHNLGVPNFDLWEEVQGQHFYTTLVQRRSLLTGAAFARFFNDTGAADWYQQQATPLAPVLAGFWDGARKYIGATRDRTGGLDYKASNLDIAVVLGALHAHGDATDGFYAPDADQVLATLLALKDAHRAAFPINTRYRADLPPALGRYTEDRYYAGNPWFLTTLAAAETQYRVVARASAQNSLTVTPVSLPFFQDLVAGTGVTVAVGPVAKGTPQFTALTQALVRAADGFMQRVRVHSGAGGRMDEQIDRYTGFMLSATDLTWNYAAFLTAAAARERARAAYPPAF
ncbi:hypothetical protein H9P43_003443 [Blastocladiella emersonii ATCC 22665]|nr:hypothetical protein H9P43_003443 [Blastocladiella emersonii ATCC 22665]